MSKHQIDDEVFIIEAVNGEKQIFEGFIHSIDDLEPIYLVLYEDYIQVKLEDEIYITRELAEVALKSAK